MKRISYARHQYPPAVIQHAVWLYLRFDLRLRDVEDLLAERGLDISYETVRRVAKFGPAHAGRLRSMRPKPDQRWHLDEMFVSIGGRTMYLGVQSMPRARCWTSWFNGGATSEPQSGSSAG